MRIRRTIVQGNITRMERRLAKLEEMETLIENEQMTVPKMVKKLEAFNACRVQVVQLHAP